mmetsp:Transcript_8911/g.11805  ORF Transcript_8911/g.11805 Transcript_8911/m.11805 type:complete len:585 (+) Transcript_8911:284-2038(+)
MARSHVVKFSLYLSVMFMVFVAVLIQRFDAPINWPRALYWCIQAVGGIFIVLLPWRYAYPKCLCRTRFYRYVVLVTGLNMAVFCLPITSTNFHVGTIEYKALKTIFEIVFNSTLFFFFPLLYLKHWVRKGALLYTCSIPFILFGAIASIASYWGFNMLMDYSVICIILWIAAVINDRKYLPIVQDYGYVLMLGIISLAVPPVLGYAMLEIIATSESLEEKLQILIIWTAICVAIRSMWNPVASGAINSHLAPTFTFPMQICVDCYDELIFGLSTWKSKDFIVLLIFRAMINFLRNSGLFSEFIRRIKSSQYFQARAQGNTEIPQRNADKDFEIIKQEMHFLEQNRVSETIASIIVLFASIFDQVFSLMKIGRRSINNGLSESQVQDVVMSYAIVATVIFLTSILSGRVLSKKFLRETYAADDASVVESSKRNDNDNGPLFVEKQRTHAKVVPFEIFSMNGSKSSKLEKNHIGFVKSPSRSLLHEMSTDSDDVVDIEHKHEVEEDQDQMGHDEESVTRKVARRRRRSSGIRHWKPSRVEQVWSQFFVYYLLAVLYNSFDVLWRVVRIYRKVRAPENWDQDPYQTS